MDNTLNINFSIPENLLNIYKKMDISPIGILSNYALNLIHGKIQKYEVENKSFEMKYNCTYEKFKEKVEGMIDEENFEWDDDLMDWQFVIENLIYWKDQIKEIKV